MTQSNCPFCGATPPLQEHDPNCGLKPLSKWKLYLDDIRPKPVGFILAKSMGEAIELIEKFGCPSFISFDHDLALDHYAPTSPHYMKPSALPTGLDFAKWLIARDLDQRGKFIPEDFAFRVHSANPVGRENIQKLMDSYLEYRKEYTTHL